MMKAQSKLNAVLAAITALVLCIALLPAPAQAAGTGDYTVRLADAGGNDVITAFPGDTVTLTLSIENNPGVIGVGVTMGYPDELSLAARPQNVSAFKDVADGFFMCSQDLTVNPYLVWWNYALGDHNKKLIVENGAMAQITFTVAADAQPGDYEISLSAPSDKNTTADTDGSGVIIDYTNAPISVETAGCTIRVEKKHNWGPWEELNEDKHRRECTDADCDAEETADHNYTWENNGENGVTGTCDDCGKVITADYLPGDIDGKNGVDSDDVIQLLLHVSMSDLFPIDVPADFTGDGEVTSDDVIQLLLHVAMPDIFPLEI